MALLAVINTTGTATTIILITALLTSLVDCVTDRDIASAHTVTSGSDANTDVDSLATSQATLLINTLDTASETDRSTITPKLMINNMNTNTETDSLSITPKLRINNLNTNTESDSSSITPKLIINNLNTNSESDSSSSTPKLKINNLNTNSETDSLNISPKPVINTPGTGMTLLAESITALHITTPPTEDVTWSDALSSVDEVFARTVINTTTEENPKLKIDNVDINTETGSLNNNSTEENPKLKIINVDINTETGSLNNNSTEENPKLKIINVDINTETGSLNNNSTEENPKLKIINVDINTETDSLNNNSTEENPKLKMDNVDINTETDSLNNNTPKVKINNVDMNTETDSLTTNSTEEISSFNVPDNASALARLLLKNLYQNKPDLKSDSNWRDPPIGDSSVSGLSPAGLICSGVFIGVPGILGNVLLFFLSFSSELRTMSYRLFLAAIAVADSLALVYLYTTALIQMFMGGGIQAVPRSESKVLCGLYNIVPYIVMTCPPWLLVVFSFDRFIAMVFPLKRKSVCTVRNTRILCAAAVLLVIVMHVPLADKFTLLRIKDKTFCYSEESDQDPYTFTTIVVNSFLPVLLVVVFNVLSLLAIKNALALRSRFTSPRAAGESSHEAQEDQERRRREAETKTRQATLSLLSVPVVSFLSMTPYTVAKACITLKLFGLSDVRSKAVWMERAQPYVMVIYCVGFAANFWLLLLTSKSYRNIAKNMLRLSRP